jgi:two-component system sensor histidine kinase QseC
LKLHSLRRRLIAYQVGLAAVLWIVAVLATTYYFRNLLITQVDNYLDQYSALSQHAFRLMRVQNSGLSEEDLKRLREERRSVNLLRVQSFRKQRATPAVNLWFNETPVVVGDNSPLLPTPVESGYLTTELDVDGKTSSWRILYSYDNEHNYWLAVAVDLENMDYFGVITLQQLLLPLLILMPLMLVFLVWGVNNGLRPLNALAQKIHSRNPSQLEPIDISEIPEELSPVVTSLNHLLGELRRALDNEKRFTSNAAHELKTTLATIQAEIQRFQQISAQGRNIDEFLDNLYTRINRASKTTTQLLQLARLDASEQGEYVTLDLKALINEEIVDLAVLACERQLELDIHGLNEPLWIDCNPDLLRILFRNLILNAFTYASFSGEIFISLQSLGGCAEFVIANECPQLQEKDFQVIPTRFYRGNRVDVHGSGLGLSIVQRIAQLHQARLEISAWREGAGFKARILIPV